MAIYYNILKANMQYGVDPYCYISRLYSAKMVNLVGKWPMANWHYQEGNKIISFYYSQYYSALIVSGNTVDCVCVCIRVCTCVSMYASVLYSENDWQGE